jgi:undecaprenyl pyrophosphate synthase
MIDKLGIRVRVMGDLSLIPEKTRNAMDKVVEYSRNNTKYALEECEK